MIDIDTYPQEWRTNKNFKWWEYHNAPRDIIILPEDCFYHEAVIVEFAKQYHAEDIQQLQARLKEAESVIDFYGEFSNWTIDYHSFEDESGDVADGEFAQTIRTDCDISNYGGKRAREYKQKYKDKE